MMIESLNILAESRLMKTTTSRCPVCLEPIPAEVHERDGRVIMAKTCVAHGGLETPIGKDPGFYT